MKDFWDDRYRDAVFAYGEEPNAFFKERIGLLPVGNLLLPAEGEGRNAVYAAGLGWNVQAFDQSAEGQKKAFHLAAQKGVSIKYEVGEFSELAYKPDSFDAIALIFAHFPPGKRRDYHRQVVPYLRGGGTLIIEGFSKAHLRYVEENPAVGGPKNEAMLFSEEELRADFFDFDVSLLECREIDLDEGVFHKGSGSVVRFVGRKQ